MPMQKKFWQKKKEKVMLLYKSITCSNSMLPTREGNMLAILQYGHIIIIHVFNIDQYVQATLVDCS